MVAPATANVGFLIFYHIMRLLDYARVLDSNGMSISLEEVRHVAKLARLELDESEVLSLQSELNALLGHFSDIQAISMPAFQPKAHAVPLTNRWREDIVGEMLPRERALRNAPLSKAGLFLVPMIIEE